ncbi:MAG: hypothetical protein ABWY82_17435 [Tardiphaga sp.]
MLAVGIERATIDISASTDTLDRRLNDQAGPAGLADMPITLEPSFMSIGHLPSAEIVAGGIAGCVTALAIAALLVARSAGSFWDAIIRH